MRSTHPFRFPALLATTLLCIATPLASAQTAAKPRPCEAKDLSLATDDENGSFNGMSHSGTLVVLRNLAPTACSLQPFAPIAFLTPEGADAHLELTPDTPFNRGPVSNGRHLPMGHGPVVLPIVLAPGAEATASLRWVSGNVYDHGTCITPASLQVTVGSAPIRTEFKRNVCGEDRSHIAVTRTPFALDPAYKP